jgi:hypothetical protein
MNYKMAKYVDHHIANLQSLGQRLDSSDWPNDSIRNNSWLHLVRTTQSTC